MRYVLLFVVFCLLASCGSARVNYDYDKKTDFSNYSTYNYYPDLKTGLTELDEKRLLNVMDITLQIKGLQYSEEPDFLINISSESYQAPRNSSVGVGLGGTGRNVGGGLSIGIPIGSQKLQRHITFDFVDSNKDELFWQAVSSNTFKENVSPIVREQKLAELVDQVLANYPPK